MSAKEPHASPTRQRKSADVRSGEIRDHAARLFHEKGYAETTVQDIADAVGMLKGSIYYHIDSKEDLLYAIIAGLQDRALECLQEWLASEGDTLSRLRRLIEGQILFHMDNRVDVAIFYRDFGALTEDRRIHVIEGRDQYEASMRSLIEEGQREGVVRADIDPKIATLGILGMVNWTYQWYRPGGPSSPSEIATHFADIVIRGVAVSSQV